MFFGIAGIVLVAFIATVATGQVWNGFAASWALDTSTHFYDLPKTLEAAKNEGWTTIEGVNPPERITPLGLEGDPTIVLLFEKSTVVGVQIAFLVADVDSNQPLKLDELHAVMKKKLNGKLFYTATVYFYNDESTDTRTIRFQEKNGFLEIPTNAALVPSETQFLLKNCIPTMGVHYYTWHSTSDCATLYPWFLLADGENMIGVGFQSFGNPTQIGNRAWWETIPDNGIYAAMNDPPACAVNGVAEFGTISMHIWFVDKPQNIVCS